MIFIMVNTINKLSFSKAPVSHTKCSLGLSLRSQMVILLFTHLKCKQSMLIVLPLHFVACHRCHPFSGSSDPLLQVKVHRVAT